MAFTSGLRRWFGRKPVPFRRRPTRLALESLEERLAPAAGDLDPTFGYGYSGVIKHDLNAAGDSDHGGFASAMARQ